jgi:non-specific serine/threonine protein kinase
LGVGEARNLLGNLARARGDYARAAAHYEAGLAVHRAAGRRPEAAAALHHLGRVAFLRDDPRRAERLFAESLALFRDLEARRGIGLCVAGLAGVAGAAGQWERAARLLGAAHTLFSAPGRELRGVNRDENERTVAAARAHLGEPAFAAAWAAGEALTVEQASAAERPLTRREQEVAALVARGLTNRQIAARLVVTERTAGTHLERIMNKLGVHARAQIAAWAVAHRLAGGPPALGSPGRPQDQGDRPPPDRNGAPEPAAAPVDDP